MSYYKARLEQQRLAPKTDHAEFPVNALIEVTNACNHACVFCHNPFMKRSAGILDRETFRRLRESFDQTGEAFPSCAQAN
jgi:MoaA/NifB/PqqE/SkfB family radical SAM enzyme